MLTIGIGIGVGFYPESVGGGSGPAHGASILMETSGYILQEDGSTILLE